MTEEIWIALITFAALQLLAAFGAWVSLQVRLRSVEIRVEVAEKQMEAYSHTMAKLVDELHSLTIQLARQNNSHT